MIFLNSLESILSIVIMISIGYILTHKGWFNEDTSKVFSKVVTHIALPPYMVWNLMSAFDRDKLFSLGRGLVIPFASMLLCYFVAFFIGKAINITPNRQGTFCSMFCVSNAVFIGLPVAIALFGEKSVPYALLYYIANTTVFWTFGVYGISSDGSAGRTKLISMETIKKTFSPPLLGFLVGVILITLGIKLPPFVLDTCKYLGNLTTPLSMLFIGIALYGVNVREIRLNKDMIAVLMGRFVVAPLTIFVCAWFLPVPLLMKEVFVILAAMPVMTQTSIVAKVFNADYGYAAVMTAVTTVIAMTTIPLYMVLMQHFF